MKKVLFIASTGGHLSELMQLKELFKYYDYHIVTEKTKTNVSLKDEYKDKIDFLIFGTKDHFLTYPFKFFINCLKSIRLYHKIKPEFIITTGTHTAVPIIFYAKLFHKKKTKVIFIETFANSVTRTLSGKMIYKRADLFVVQWKSMQKLYPKATYGGWIY